MKSSAAKPDPLARSPRDSFDEDGFAPALTDIPGDRNFVAALARGVAVLLSFSDRRRHLSMAEVSYRTGISRAAVRRSLYTLERLGYVVKDESRRYHLRARVLTFGHAYLSGTPISIVSQPVLDRLSERIMEPCSLALLEGDEIIYVARSRSSQIMSPALNVGRRLPAYCTSIGRVLLANAPASYVDTYLKRVDLRAFTSQTTTSRRAFRRILDSARVAGYATADQQMEPHFRTIAVPVHNKMGDLVAGMNVIIQNERFSMQELADRFLEPLRSAADELGDMLLP